MTPCVVQLAFSNQTELSLAGFEGGMDRSRTETNQIKILRAKAPKQAAARIFWGGKLNRVVRFKIMFITVLDA